MAFFKVIITVQIMEVFQKIFCILNFSVRSLNVPNFIEIQKKAFKASNKTVWRYLFQGIAKANFISLI